MCYKFGGLIELADLKNMVFFQVFFLFHHFNEPLRTLVWHKELFKVVKVDDARLFCIFVEMEVTERGEHR